MCDDAPSRLSKRSPTRISELQEVELFAKGTIGVNIEPNH
jgi:hypothetical protein